MSDVDWNADAWFERCIAHKLTPEFKRWWVGFYGLPLTLGDDDDAHEYWVRCAFAWHGWNARG